MAIRLVTYADLNDWLELAKEVEPLFGKMVECEGFQEGIKETVTKSSAFCVIDTNNKIGGIIAVDKSQNEILWLAVHNKHRLKGYGRRLLKAAMDSLDATKPIYVQTFSDGITEGEAARRLYEQFGFVDYKEAGKNPAGFDTVIMRFASANK